MQKVKQIEHHSCWRKTNR